MVTTTPIIPAGSQLRVSADVQNGGWLKVTALDAEEKTLGTSQAITRTGSDAVVNWDGDFILQSTIGKSVRLKFRFAMANL